MDFLLVLLVLALLATFVTLPLRRARTTTQREAERMLRAEREVQDLEAAREAKYREIRDAEMDRNTGKLSAADWQALDRTLRGEAIELLRSLDKATAALKRREAEAEADAAAQDAEE